MSDRLFIAVRGDIPIGLAAAQAVHAAFSFADRHLDRLHPWLTDPFLVVVTVPDEVALIGLSSRAIADGVALTVWHEPDHDDQAMAVAFEPGPAGRRLCANLPLLGRELAVT